MLIPHESLKKISFQLIQLKTSKYKIKCSYIFKIWFVENNHLKTKLLLKKINFSFFFNEIKLVKMPSLKLIK